MKRQALLWGAATAGLALMLGGIPAFATLDGSKALKDGRKIQIEGNRVSECVPLLNPQPKAAPAPAGANAQQCPGVWRPLKDGTYTLQGGKTIEIKNGSLVSAPKK